MNIIVYLHRGGLRFPSFCSASSALLEDGTYMHPSQCMKTAAEECLTRGNGAKVHVDVGKLSPL